MKGLVFQSFAGSFESGCLQASKALTVFSGVPVQIDSSEAVFKAYNQNNLKTLENQFYNILLAVDFFGAITGKVCLLGTKDELELITMERKNQQIIGSRERIDFWREVGNILTASIIDNVKENVDDKIYLDAPLVIESNSLKKPQTIFDDSFGRIDNAFFAYARLSVNVGISFIPLLLLVLVGNKSPHFDTCLESTTSS